MTVVKKRKLRVTSAVVIALMIWTFFVVPAITTNVACDFVLGLLAGGVAGPFLIYVWYDELFGRWS